MFYLYNANIILIQYLFCKYSGNREVFVSIWNQYTLMFPLYIFFNAMFFHWFQNNCPNYLFILKKNKKY